MKLTHIVLMAAAISFASCNSSEPSNNEDHDQSEHSEGNESHEENHDNEAGHDNHEGHDHGNEMHNETSETETSWIGTYQAMATCPGCDGVIKEISLKEDMTYMQVSKHHGDHIGDVAESGRFTWADEKEQVLIISAGTGAELKYDIEGEALIGLNKAGEKREGDGYGLYTLVKLKESEPIFDKKWILKAIDGEEILASEDRSDAVVLFTEEGTISGTASCNDFNGTYKLDADGNIKFGPMAATKKMCGDMRVEDKFLAGMAQVNKYVVHGAKMSLHIDGAAAKFKFEMAK